MYVANVVHGGDTAFNALLYRNQNPLNQQFITQQLQNFSTTLTDVGQSFMQRTMELYDTFNNSEVMRIARAALNMSKSVFSPNDIVELKNINDFQSASLIMQRYIMACPDVRQAYIDKRCNGYADTYVDMQPGKIAEDHYDYCMVMDGVVEEGSKDQDEWVYRTYLEEIHDGDRMPTPFEKFKILESWEVAKMIMSVEKDDPTSAYGGNM